MITRRRSSLDVGMSFLDVISCGFGAIVMLVILAKDDDVPIETNQSTESISQAPNAHNVNGKLSRDIEQLKKQLNVLVEKEKTLENRIKTVSNDVRVKKDKIKQEAKRKNTRLVSKSDEKNLGTMKSIYAGGIPVDREHIVFIIDTSGSMKRFWPIVEKQIEAILSLHPRVKGIQIMSDNGDYLLNGYASRWIPDTIITRQRIIKKLGTWTTFSRSNPTKGLEKALRFHAKESGGISIYVMGDDFTGSSYDEVLIRVEKLNPIGENQAQIHGIAFPWGIGDRFSTLMRELALQNNGVFVTIHHPMQY